jgi:folate-dependent phosphoribosylglycinamide formyltransferase PurN
VLARREVEVRADDTPESLAARVQGGERALLVETLAAIAAGRIALPAARSGDRAPARGAP